MRLLKKRKNLTALFLIFINITTCLANIPLEIENIKKIFQKYNINGSIIIYDHNNNKYFGYNLERCNIGFIPASTFKISNTLIALETGVITMDSIFHWKGEKRAYPNWESDMNIEQAFKVSNVPVYKDIARHIGLERMKKYLSLIYFGKMDINANNLDKFWLEGNSQVTQYQQIYFLQKLYKSEFPLKTTTMDNVKHIMLLEKTDDYTLRGKTGLANNIGWFVGYFETKDNVYFFATNIEPTNKTDMKQFVNLRVDLTKDIILNEVNIIKNN